MDQHVKSTRPGHPYTGRQAVGKILIEIAAFSLILVRLHACVLLAESSTTYTSRPHTRVYLTALNMN
ncbi:tRNA-specific 2-thiouridylase mnmA [Gossypium arboreum]|uniref:tRNA-specific 2-thiouridylase mnmA n=1 Tax=Gossypium arboreum TaxID=29729 RepID=A0A0B0MBB7_GOSAR|nr:tRNA-specific 2-thiouridylase mnmA [Gossypium arboreum]